MSLRILHISTRLILGGSQENTVLSCEGQARLGHDVHLAYGPIYGPEGSMHERVSRFRTEDGRGIALHELPRMVREIRPVKDHVCFHHDLKKLMREVRPDVVHTHSSKAGVLGRWAAWTAEAGGKRPAVIHTIHGPPFMPASGDSIERTKTRAKNTLYAAAERFAAKRCHLIVSVADAMTEQFLARGIGRPDQYITVRSGMELEPFLRAKERGEGRRVREELGLRDGDFVIGTVSRLAEHKGHDDLLNALGGELRARPSWKLLWVGDGRLRDRLMARVRSMGLEGRVITTGLVPPERVPAMMTAMDVLAHPSHREGLPRTVPQALLCDVCPVAHDVDGTGEICRDWETGRLVAPGDRDGLRAAIVHLAENPMERERMAERGRALVMEEFSAETMVRHLEGVYARALEMR